VLHYGPNRRKACVVVPNDRMHPDAPDLRRPVARQLQVHGYTRSGQLDRLEVRGWGTDHPMESSHDRADQRHALSLPCLIFRPRDDEGHEQLLMQVSWDLLNKPKAIWTASSTSLEALTTGTAPDQTTSGMTATYGRFGLVNRTWNALSNDRYYMVAWTM
jgi:hypothetical protein